MNGHWQTTPSGKVRARGLGLPFPGNPGPFNAITDVEGVEIGYATIIGGEGPLVRGVGPVRTGVTAILPRGREGAGTPCFAGAHTLNGNGEMTGLAWIEEIGQLQTPVTITNTHSCGTARDATLKWMANNAVGMGQDWGLPVAAETWDGELNDINGFHVRDEHVFAALDVAASGPLELGSVGGGTGMICYDFKGGNGSASRQLVIDGRTFTLGAFVQANFGRREQLSVLGVPVGAHITRDKLRGRDVGSVIAVVATDAPLLPHQLKRIARRVTLGLARTGTTGGHSSGDIFLAFSTANPGALASAGRAVRQADFLADAQLDPIFSATVEAVEESVIDAMVANATMVGRDGATSIALPHGELLSLMRRYGRMT